LFVHNIVKWFFSNEVVKIVSELENAITHEILILLGTMWSN